MSMTINKLDTANEWMVDSSHIYIPSTPCKVEHSNVAGASTGRDETGVMHIDWVRRDVRKVNLHYNAITATELATMMNLMQGKEFTFKFKDQGSVQTINAYVGESSYEAYSFSSAYGDGVYTNFDIHVIEL